jgi:hypothetical protein
MPGVANTLSAQGLDSAGLFAQAGLRIENLDDCDFRWPTEGVSKLWTIAAERSGNYCRLESLDCRYAKALAAPGHSRRTTSKTDRAFSSDGTPDANQTVNKNRAAARVD